MADTNRTTLKELTPSQEYAVQVRAVYEEGPGPWSETLAFETPHDGVAPLPPPNLNVHAIGPDFIANWDETVENEDGSVTQDLRDYQVNIYPTGEPARVRTFYTTALQFELAYDLNRALFDSPEPSITFELRSRDESGNISTDSITDSDTVPAPGAFSLIVTSGVNSLKLDWTEPSGELRRFDIFKDSVEETSVAESTRSWVDVDPGSGEIEYFIRVVDMFSRTNDSNTDSEQAIPIDVEQDTTAPKPPTDLTFNNGDGIFVDGTNNVIHELGWTSPVEKVDDSEYENHEGFQLRYRTDPARPYNFVNVPDDRADGTVAEDFEYDIEIEQQSNVEWGVRAFDRPGNYSTWATSSNTADIDTDPPAKPSTPIVAGDTNTLQVTHNLDDDTATPYTTRVDLLEVYAGQSDVFSEMDKIGSFDVTSLIKSGIASVTTFSYPVEKGSTSRHVRVVAVSQAGEESVPSDAAPVTIELIDGINIKDATISNAHITGLDAQKLNADSAFINNLFIRSSLEVDHNDGEIVSDNFNATEREGWGLTRQGLFLYDGEVDAKKLTIQDNPNLLDHGYTTFTYQLEWYEENIDVVGAGASIALTGLGARYGVSALRVLGDTGDTFTFSPDGENNINLDDSTYILSAYVTNNSGAAASINLNMLWGATSSETETVAFADGEMKRIWVVFSTGAVDEGVPQIELVDNGSDFYVDGMQLEERTGFVDEPSAFKVGGITTIDGGQITTGSMVSNNFVAGEQGWTIGLDGNVEFDDGIFRGEIDGATVRGSNLFLNRMRDRGLQESIDDNQSSVLRRFDNFPVWLQDDVENSYPGVWTLDGGTSTLDIIDADTLSSERGLEYTYTASEPSWPQDFWQMVGPEQDGAWRVDDIESKHIWVNSAFKNVDGPSWYIEFATLEYDIQWNLLEFDDEGSRRIRWWTQRTTNEWENGDVASQGPIPVSQHDDAHYVILLLHLSPNDITESKTVRFSDIEFEPVPFLESARQIEGSDNFRVQILGIGDTLLRDVKIRHLTPTSILFPRDITEGRIRWPREDILEGQSTSIAGANSETGTWLNLNVNADLDHTGSLTGRIRFRRIGGVGVSTQVLGWFDGKVGQEAFVVNEGIETDLRGLLHVNTSGLRNQIKVVRTDNAMGGIGLREFEMAPSSGSWVSNHEGAIRWFFEGRHAITFTQRSLGTSNQGWVLSGGGVFSQSGLLLYDDTTRIGAWNGQNWHEMMAASFPTGSDRRLKENIEEDVENHALSEIKAARCHRFHKKGSTVVEQVGPMAEDLPDIVKADPDEDGNEFVSLDAMVGLLWKAVQEQQDQIEELQSQLA